MRMQTLSSCWVVLLAVRLLYVRRYTLTSLEADLIGRIYFQGDLFSARSTFKEITFNDDDDDDDDDDVDDDDDDDDDDEDGE